MQAVRQRLGEYAVEPLLSYIRILPRGEDGERATSNPLMLSMVISVFEQRRGHAMPATKSELYEVATTAMLARTGGRVDVSNYLEALFLRAHIEAQRIITIRHLEIAAREIQGGQEALRALRDLIDRDRMPLLSVLQVEPLLLQSSHLSFQEFFAARAISQGTDLPMPPDGQTWKWNEKWCAWWKNVVDFGLELGEQFCEGLGRAAGAAAGMLDLSRKVYGGGERKSAILMVCSMMSASTVTKVDLSGNSISAEEAAVLADGLCRSESLTSMDMADNRLGDAGKLALARAISSSNLLYFKCGGLDLHADVECLDLSWQNLGPADLELLAAGMRQFMHTLVQVRFVATVLACAFVNSCSNSLPTQLDLSYNMLCGIDADGNGTYTTQGLRLIANAITTSTCEQASFVLGFWGSPANPWFSPVVVCSFSPLCLLFRCPFADQPRFHSALLHGRVRTWGIH